MTLVTRRTITRAPLNWADGGRAITSTSIGINLPWLNNHNGGQVANFIGTAYDAAKIHADIDLIASMGVRRVRLFVAMESLFSWDGSHFSPVAAYMANLHDLLGYLATKNMQAIVIMGDGHVDSAPQNLDGKFRWDLIQTTAGVNAIVAGLMAYVREFDTHDSVLMYEMHNEPYGAGAPGGWGMYAQTLGITEAQIHHYLLTAYTALKPLTARLVGFSDYEEEEQAKFHRYSDPAIRAATVDDCTDVYSMHFYRVDQSQLYDFRGLGGKPKWASELGGYNFTGQLASITGHGELYDETANSLAYRTLARKLYAMGFELTMVWSLADNPGFVVHNADGSHTLKALAKWIKNQLVPRGFR